MKTTHATCLVLFLCCLLLPMGRTLQAQEYPTSMERDYARLKPWFEAAYQRYPKLPRGVLEAVSYTYTRFFPPSEKDTLERDPHVMPQTYTVMGLTRNGKGYFRENLRLISYLSGVPVDTILQNDRAAIMAYASSMMAHAQKLPYDSVRPIPIEAFKPIFTALSEIPETCTFALNSSLYAIYKCLSDSSLIEFGIPVYSVDFHKLFGSALSQLQRGFVPVEPLSPQKTPRKAKGVATTDYSSALWVPAASCNYSSRNGTVVNHVTIHYTSGTYAGSIAWFQNCAAKASAHYLIRSMDGQVAQLVREADKAWHVGVANGYTIGIEHEAYGNVAAFFTNIMYASSVALVRDICARHPAINPLHAFYRDTLDDGTVLNNGLHSLGGASACTQIRGHQHFPNQTHTDPGPYWNWNLYYKLINPVTLVDTATGTTGLFYDSGGSSGPYGDDERRLFWVHVPGSDSIVLDFRAFQLEADYDFMWIYEGADEFAPLMGRWNTQSPGRVAVRGGDLLVEFRSDCAGVAPGWEAQWTAYVTPRDTAPPTTQILVSDTTWITGDFVAHFQDTDDGDVESRFFQTMECENQVWSANPQAGFFCDNFDSTLAYTGWVHDGQWQVENRALKHVCQGAGRSWVSAPLNGTIHSSYLYDFYLSMDDAGQCTFVFHAEDSGGNPGARFLAVTFNKDNNTLCIWRRRANETDTLYTANQVYYATGQRFLYRVVWDTLSRRIRVFRHQVMLAETYLMTDNAYPARFMGFLCDGAGITIDNFRVYGNRTDSVLVTVGASADKMIRRQAERGTPMSKLKSLIMDSAGKFSTLQEKLLRVDYTPPLPVRGLEARFRASSLQTGMRNGVLQLSWGAARDGQSGVCQYDYILYVEQSGRVLTMMNRVDNSTMSVVRKLALPMDAELRIGVMAEDAAAWKSSVITRGVPLR